MLRNWDDPTPTAPLPWRQASRPLLFGPDPHSFKENGPDDALLAWVGDFLDGLHARGVLLTGGVTHHEYVEVDATSFTSAAALDVGGSIAAAFNATVAARYAAYDDDGGDGAEEVVPMLVAGEIGPHNGGSPPCDHTSLRWASGRQVVATRRVESSRVESSRVESSRVESSRVESSRVESSRVESSRVEARRAEPSRV